MHSSKGLQKQSSVEVDRDMGAARMSSIKQGMAQHILEKTDDVLNEELEYSERQTKQLPFDYAGFATFVLFLGTFW